MRAVFRSWTMCLALMIAASVTAAYAGEWPRFLGPDGSGVVAKGEKIARTWPGGGRGSYGAFPSAVVLAGLQSRTARFSCSTETASNRTSFECWT